jgi:signal peptidase I
LLRDTRTEAVEVGEVILFQRKDHLVMHRVTDTHRTEAGNLVIETKGDNNRVHDEPIAADDVKARFVALLPLRSLSGIDAGLVQGARYVLTATVSVLAIWRTRVILRHRLSAT